MSSIPTTSSAAGSTPVFRAHGRNFSLEQTLQAAEFRGELQPYRSRWWHEFGRAGLADIPRDGIAQAAVQRLQDDYRYRRNLTTAEECEEWLAARGVTVEEFRGHFVRRQWAAKLGSKPGHDEAKLRIEADEAAARAFRTDVVLSTEFERMARNLAWRAALGTASDRRQPFLRERAAAPPDTTESAAERLTLDGPEWRSELERMESEFQRECKRVLTPERRRQGLASMRPYLLRLDLEILEVDSEAAAREAFLCVKQDGLSLAGLAAGQGYPLKQEQPLLEDLPSHWQPALLGACPGSVLAPFRMGRRYRLIGLKSKAEPGLSDPGVQRSVDAGIIRRHFLELELRHVRWHMSIDEEA